MRNSLSWRFNLSAVSVVTLILALFGVYDVRIASAELNATMDENIFVLTESLQNTVPSLIWNFELEQLNRNLNSAIKNQSIVSILVTDGKVSLGGFSRSPLAEIKELSDIELMGAGVQLFPLEYEEGSSINTVGQLLVVKNTLYIEQKRKAAIRATIVKIVVLDFLVVLSLSQLITRLVKTPLSHVAEALKDISSGDGDLTQRLVVTRQDEIGMVATYFNIFVEKIQEAMIQVDRSAAKMQESVELLNLTATANSESVANIHLQTDQVATAINEMSSTAHEVALNAQKTSEATRNAGEETKNTQNVIQQTTNTIASLASDINSGAGVMDALQGDVNGIISVLETIRGIAEQTNLLALNAAIEAARAGDQGRGFAVVADEVRALAGRTQQSTEEIRVMIEKLKQGSAQASLVMQTSKQRSDESVESVEKAIGSLAQITQAIETISDMSTQIAAAVEEQTQVSEEINRTVIDISRSIEDTAEGAKETASTTVALTENARVLKALVGQFRLD
ncbi:methyl-accepting chemotaxis protein [Reinekea sp.]|jgi:methyl-accepting chemotaxis protein|uniref:methyl-accepting chemotaxis protein n=1 Tax=Reinekea sp. TaxID=1970455 RepID=UPI002A7EC046|nr:methyl-accepting chemotaxis protein [Reinekea sp.]